METITAPNYARVKREVVRLIDEFGITAPPVNPVEIARELGVSVFFVTFGGDFKNISGFYDCEDNAIFVNEAEYPLRQTFTVAHELGHQILHSEWAKSSDYKMLMRDSDYAGNEPHEKEANAFAAHLLVPRFLLDGYWKSTSVEGLSKLFAVSVPMIKNRLSWEYGV
jgi:Zn-dependent peptidase ImmA (M78 family)